MLDDVGTSCATTNATPETSFCPHATVWMPRWPGPETAGGTWGVALVTIAYAPNAPEHSP